jgi:hypothetical protein
MSVVIEARKTSKRFFLRESNHSAFFRGPRRDGGRAMQCCRKNALIGWKESSREVRPESRIIEEMEDYYNLPANGMRYQLIETV